MAKQEIKPRKKLSECANGWELRWQAYNKGDGKSNSNFQSTYVSKNHVKHHNGRGINYTLSRSSEVIYKYVYTYDDKMIGYDSNEDDRNHRIALTGVFEW